MATTQSIIDYYSSLLILQYLNKPKAVATIQALIGPAIMDQLPLLVQGAYDINTAVGVQLDVLGKYAGVARTGYDFSGPVVLDDSDFRQLIQMAILTNNSRSSLADIQNLIAIFFPMTLAVFDYLGMRMSYFMASSVGSVSLAQYFVKQGLLPKPMGVELGALIYAPNINSFFGCRTYELAAFNNSPLNIYSTYHTDYPWLSYQDAVII